MFRLINILFIALAITSCQENTDVRDKFDEKMLPNEQLNFKLSFPDARLDLRAYERAYQKSNLNRMQKSSDFEWTNIGPKNIGGRINCIEVHPENQEIILVGNSTGGIFRTEDGGHSWVPISDALDYLAIGSIAYDPIDPSVIYAGTGDPNIGGIPHPGNGVYKSTDNGETWTHMGLEMERIISKIVINPVETNIIYAGAMGVPFEENVNRGLYRSEDSGETWEQILFVDEDAGIIDLIINPQNPEILYASSWNRIRNNQVSTINGPDAHIFKSIDGGDSWQIIENGLPEGEKGRIGLAMSGQNYDVIFTVIVGLDSQLQGIYKSVDAGENWTQIPTDETLMFNALGGFGWYFGVISVSPYNDNEISLLGVDMFTTMDSGENWNMSVPVWWFYSVHADKHDMVYLDENTVLLATDGGLYKTTDHFVNWTDIDDIPNTQFYRLGLDPHNPDFYTGGAQDNGTTTGNLDSINDWSRDYGGDGFQPLFDPFEPGLRYAMTQNGNFVYRTAETWWEQMNDGIDPLDRRNWDTPLIMSHHDNSVLYTGTFRVYINEIAPFGGWAPISPDLTDGVIYGDRFHNISTVAESRVNEEVLYAGTSDGNVWRRMSLSTDWENITEGLPERYVTNIKTSEFEEGVVLVSHSGFKDNDQTAHLHRSADYGDTWVDITGDLPEQPINHIELINDSVIFIATDFGVYYTQNMGENWLRIGNNMPLIPVTDIEMDTINDILVAATYARSMWTFPVDSLDFDTTIPEDTTDVNVSELKLSKTNLIFPNPADEFISIKTELKNYEYSILNSQGMMILEGEVFDFGQKIDVSELSSGVYYVRIQGNNSLEPFIIF